MLRLGTWKYRQALTQPNGHPSHVSSTSFAVSSVLKTQRRTTSASSSPQQSCISCRMSGPMPQQRTSTKPECYGQPAALAISGLREHASSQRQTQGNPRPFECLMPQLTLTPTRLWSGSSSREPSPTPLARECLSTWARPTPPSAPSPRCSTTWQIAVQEKAPRLFIAMASPHQRTVCEGCQACPVCRTNSASGLLWPQLPHRCRNSSCCSRCPCLCDQDAGPVVL